jgi:hypothetical protein
MWRRFLALEWTPDPATVGLVVFGFSVVSAASGLMLANVALGEVFNIPPSGFVSFPIGPFTYPLAVRVEAGSAFVMGCAAAFAAAGGLALYARVHWGAALTASALGVEGAATLVNLIAEPGGVLMIQRVLSVIWTVVLICLVTGFRPSLPRSTSVGSVTTGSWMEETSAPERDESSADQQCGCGHFTVQSMSTMTAPHSSSAAGALEQQQLRAPQRAGLFLVRSARARVCVQTSRPRIV